MMRSTTAVAMLAVALWALAGVATAQQAPFPYGRCAYSPGKSNYYIKSYRLDGDGVCWTIGYSATCYRNDDPCCNRDLYKVMLDARYECANGTTVTGTIDGRALIPTKIRFAVPPYSPSPDTDMTINIADLDKDFGMTQTGYFATNSEVELCVAFSGTCSTLTEILPSGRACEWDIALWNRDPVTGNHHDCCPTFNYNCGATPSSPAGPSGPSPRSPSPSPSPSPSSSPSPSPSSSPSPSPGSSPSPSPGSSPSPSPGSSPSPSPGSSPSPSSPSESCMSCWVWTTEQTGNTEFYPYDDAETCDAARNSILEAMTNLNENQGGNAILSGFDDEGTQCDGDRIFSCGAFVSTEAGSAFVDALTSLFSPSEQIAVGVPESLRTEACTAGANFRLRGYTNEGGVPGAEVNDNSPADVCAPEADDACRPGEPTPSPEAMMPPPGEDTPSPSPAGSPSPSPSPAGSPSPSPSPAGSPFPSPSPASSPSPSPSPAGSPSPSPAGSPTPAPDTGFPFCACNKRPNATPFKLSDLTEEVVGEDTGRSRTCFIVEANPDVDTSLPCGRTTELLKVEFHLNYDSRFSMTDIYTSKDGETPQKRAQSWDITNGVLKVSPLGWTVDDLELNPRICFEFKAGFSLDDVVLTPGQMQYSAFDPTKGCCATNWYYYE